MISWAITFVWIVLINCFIIPLFLYGPSFLPGNFDSLYAQHVLFVIITGIIVSPLTDLN